MSDRLDREFRFVLRQCSKLSDAENRFMGLMGCYRHGCLLTYDELCSKTGWSRAKLKRTIKALEQYGLIEVTYRAFKKTTIMNVSARQQKAFADAHDGSPMSHQSWLTGEPMMAHPRTHDGSPMSHSINKRELQRKLKSDFLNEEKNNVDNFEPKIKGEAWQQVMNSIRSKNKEG